MRHPLYLTFGILLLAWLAFASYQRIPWATAKINQAKVAPRTIRDNPGAYRSIYAGYIHYTGGK
jgi:hypothetical protein